MFLKTGRQGGGISVSVNVNISINANQQKYQRCYNTESTIANGDVFGLLVHSPHNSLYHQNPVTWQQHDGALAVHFNKNQNYSIGSTPFEGVAFPEFGLVLQVVPTLRTLMVHEESSKLHTIDSLLNPTQDWIVTDSLKLGEANTTAVLCPSAREGYATIHWNTDGSFYCRNATNITRAHVTARSP